MSFSLKHTIKRWARVYMPPRWRHRLRIWHSLRLVRRFDPRRWPPAVIVGRLLRPGDLVVDAGANIGYVTSLFSQWVGSSGRVISLEPEPSTFDVLSRVAHARRWSNVQLINAAVSSREAEGVLVVPAYGDGGENLYEARLVAESDAAWTDRTVRVRTVTLDGLAGDGPAPVLIKLDVEGHEWAAVQGATRLLARARPAWLIEVGSDPWRADTPAGQLFARLLGAGYAVYRAMGERLVPVHPGESVDDVFFLAPDHGARLGRTA